MSGPDLSRSSFDPAKDHSLAIAMQGRVLLDDDINAASEILDRRLRATNYDLAGLALLKGTHDSHEVHDIEPMEIRGIAAVPKTTPHAFEIVTGRAPFADPNKHYIGQGRMYVDGLLVENHGTAPVWDPALEEMNGSWGCEYGDQQWFKGGSLEDGTHLVYLVCALRTTDGILDPTLIDPAFDLDTTVRRQVVWKVCTLDLGREFFGGSETPDDEIPGWEGVIAPSSGRLTTRLVQPPDLDEVCVLPPSSGYRGLENQFFRVEVVEAGGLGTARVVVSCENGSVRTELKGTDGKRRARVASVGRDDVLSFRAGDVVQIIDEATELSWIPDPRAAGPAGGVFARVKDADRDEGWIEFETDALNDYVGMTSQALADLRVRLVRWEAPDKLFAEDGTDITASHLDARGTILVSAKPVRLQSGIVIEFTDAGGPGFLIGDSFTFAARYRTGEIEELKDAPPISLHRHYARLGLWTNGTFLDWRRLVPQQQEVVIDIDGDPCEGCDIRVTPDSHNNGDLTILDAIIKADSRGGGVVTLCPGIYDIPEPMVLKGHSGVNLRGSGPATELRGKGVAIFVVEDCSALRFEDFRIVTGASSTQIVFGTRSNGFDLSRLELVAVTERAVEDAPAPLLAINGLARRITVSRCLLQGAIGIGEWNGGMDGVESHTLHTVQGLDIVDCRISGYLAGVRLNQTVVLVGQVVVRSSTVICTGGPGIEVLGAGLEGSTVRVEGNAIAAADDGVTVGSVTSVVADNTIRSFTASEKREYGAGVKVVESGLLFRERLTHLEPGPQGTTTVIRDNTIEEFAFGVVASTRLLTIEVAGNTILSSTFGVVVAGQSGGMAVRSNTIRTLIPAREFTAYGIVAAGGDSVHIDGNLVDGGAPGAHEGDLDEEVVRSDRFIWPGLRADTSVAGGVLVLAAREISIVSNRIRNILPVAQEVGQGDGGVLSAVGIRVVGPFSSVSVGDNTVHATAESQDLGPFRTTTGRWQALVVEDVERGPLTAYTGAEDRPSIRGMASVPVRSDSDPFARLIIAGENAWIVDGKVRDREVGIHDNLLTETVLQQEERERPLVMIAVSSRDHGVGTGIVRFAGNGVRGRGTQTVVIVADFANVTGNTVVMGELFVDAAGRSVIVGNLAWRYDPAIQPTPALWPELNPF